MWKQQNFIVWACDGAKLQRKYKNNKYTEKWCVYKINPRKKPMI